MNRFKTDILFSGYYGMRNTGDDAFVEIAQWGSKEFWATDSVRFLAKSSVLPTTMTPVQGYPFSIPLMYRLQRWLLLKKTKYLVMAGGSTFNDVQRGSIKDIAQRMKAKNHKLKLGAIGVSIGPFTSSESERQIVAYLKNMDFLSLRDTRSYEFAKSLNLDYEPVEAFDLAAMLPEIYGSEPIAPKKEKMIGVSFNQEESHIVGGDLRNETRRKQFMVNVLRHLNANSAARFRFFIFNANAIRGDEEITKEIIQESGIVDFEVFPYNESVISTWKAIRECSLMVSSRLHASIFACFAGIPFFSIEYHRKCTDFLKDVGQHQGYLWGDGEIDPEVAARGVLTVLEEQKSYIEPKFRDVMKEKAKRNFNSIRIQR